MRIGRNLRDDILTIAQPRVVRIGGPTLETIAGVTMHMGTYYSVELQQKATLGLWDETGANTKLNARATAGDWTAADPE